MAFSYIESALPPPCFKSYEIVQARPLGPSQKMSQVYAKNHTRLVFRYCIQFIDGPLAVVDKLGRHFSIYPMDNGDHCQDSHGHCHSKQQQQMTCLLVSQRNRKRQMTTTATKSDSEFISICLCIFILETIIIFVILRKFDCPTDDEKNQIHSNLPMGKSV